MVDERGKVRCLVVCSFGWGWECASEWAAQSVSKLHPQLAPMDLAHVAGLRGRAIVERANSSRSPSGTLTPPGASRHTRQSPEGDEPPSSGFPPPASSG